MALKGNKGEWSELYVHLKLMVEGKLYEADENLSKIDDSFFQILQIIRDEAKKRRIYNIGSEVRIIDGSSNQLIISLPTDEILKNTDQLFEGIKNGKGSSFDLPEFDEFLAKAEFGNLKAKSIDKSDIVLKVHDFNTNKKAKFGFSIKSLLGKESTLFNAGAGTNFIYQVNFPKGSQIDIKKFNKDTICEPKITSRIEAIQDLGGSITFTAVQSSILERNLEIIDSKLPEMLAHCLLIRYITRKSRINEVLEILKKQNPLHYNFSEGHPFYEFKMKNFLTDAALGMTPETVWNGHYDATGGIIFVKESGEALCYHIYNRNEFQEYLINHTRFEQASTSEDKKNPGNPLPKSKPYKYGWLYNIGNSFFIKLNLQIRFVD